jgi:hypothetical protein
VFVLLKTDPGGKETVVAPGVVEWIVAVRSGWTGTPVPGTSAPIDWLNLWKSWYVHGHHFVAVDFLFDLVTASVTHLNHLRRGMDVASGDVVKLPVLVIYC